MHQVLRLDDDHAGDVLRVGVLGVVWAGLLRPGVLVLKHLLLHRRQRRILNQHVIHELVPI